MRDVGVTSRWYPPIYPRSRSLFTSSRSAAPPRVLGALEKPLLVSATATKPYRLVDFLRFFGNGAWLMLSLSPYARMVHVPPQSPGPDAQQRQPISAWDTPRCWTGAIRASPLGW